ncbi:hypothetical protein MP228_009280 [Amoeboaphelidium protococcarum]|nr:hypothetical protein MP228_009280 [Amoeboaphelidium protococcarum]
MIQLTEQELNRLQIAALKQTLEIEVSARRKAEAKFNRLEREVEDLTALLFMEASDRVETACRALDMEQRKRIELQLRLKRLEMQLLETSQIKEIQALELNHLKQIIAEIDSQRSGVVDSAQSYSLLQ